jgi:hypothetical protein
MQGRLARHEGVDVSVVDGEEQSGDNRVPKEKVRKQTNKWDVSSSTAGQQINLSMGSLARSEKWPGPTSYFGPTSWAWAEKSSPIDKLGWAWAEDLADLGKARPDNPMIFWPDGSGLGRKTRPGSRVEPGLSSSFLSQAFCWSSLARRHAQV